MSQNKTAVNRAARKKRVAIWNRRLAWVTFSALFIGSVFFYSPVGQKWPALVPAGSFLVNAIFTPLFLTHAAFSVYLFGFPKFKTNIRVFHIYIGYAVFALTMVSQSLIGFEPYHKIFFALNWVAIFAHIVLSAKFMLQRRGLAKRIPEMAYYTGGKLLRDATPEQN